MTTPTNQNSSNAAAPAEKQQRIEAHKTLATHLETAAKHHTEAAKFHSILETLMLELFRRRKEFPAGAKPNCGLAAAADAGPGVAPKSEKIG